MRIYPLELAQGLAEEQFEFVNLSEQDYVLTICLDRPARKNALHQPMLNELAFALQYAHDNPSIRAVVIEAKGDVFCAGADLKALAGSPEPHASTIPPPARDIIIRELFSELHKPLIAKVNGDVYAGGMMFLAGAHFVIAADHVRLSLPEVKRGLFPFRVMAALLEVMPARAVLDWCLRGSELSLSAAVEHGLVSEICEAASLDEAVKRIVDELTANSPTAIRLGLEAYDHIRRSRAEHEYLAGMLKKAIRSEDGREGLAAFREKRAPRWSGE